MGKRDEVLTARANRIARHTVRRWAEKNNHTGVENRFPRIYVKHVRKGRANFSRKEVITVPVWTYRRCGKHYFRYYVLHEVAHILALLFLKRGHGHTSDFHKIEKELCDEWKLELRRTTAYPSSIDYKGREVYKKGSGELNDKTRAQV